MNTPEPCSSCIHCKYDAMQKNNPDASAWCELEVKNGWGNRWCPEYKHYETESSNGFSKTISPKGVTMKTKVDIIIDVPQCRIKRGSTGYIDGYCMAGDNLGYAVVVSGLIIDFVPLYALKPIELIK